MVVVLQNKLISQDVIPFKKCFIIDFCYRTLAKGQTWDEERMRQLVKVQNTKWGNTNMEIVRQNGQARPTGICFCFSSAKRKFSRIDSAPPSSEWIYGLFY